MIFVTVGGSSHDFSRLIKKVDEIKPNLDEKIIMQIGDTKYKPNHTRFFRYTSNAKINDLYKKSRLIIGHAGIGTIITAYSYDKPMIIVPRQKKYNEHYDNHQLEISKKLEKENIGVVVYNIENLENVLNKDYKKIRSFNTKNKLISKLNDYIKNIE